MTSSVALQVGEGGTKPGTKAGITALTVFRRSVLLPEAPRGAFLSEDVLDARPRASMPTPVQYLALNSTPPRPRYPVAHPFHVLLGGVEHAGLTLESGSALGV